MVFFTIALIIYIFIGALLGGLYYYLSYQEEGFDDLEDMHYLPIWIAALWIAVAPLAFAIYYAKEKAENKIESRWENDSL